MIDPKKIANNILDFLIDPTRVPVKERVYFRPEENLLNESYESAKADAMHAFKDQKHNSDFYPQKNRNQSNIREASIMDRKSLIVSMDVLSRNFKNEQDPFAVSLRTMAMALAKIDDETLSARLASEAPELEENLIEAKKKVETFPCPKCGTGVLNNTKYCIKCKGKVEPKTAEDKEAMSPATTFGDRFQPSSALPGGTKINPTDPQFKMPDPAVFEKKEKEIKNDLNRLNLSPEFLNSEAGRRIKDMVNNLVKSKAAGLAPLHVSPTHSRGEGSSATPGGAKALSVYSDLVQNFEKLSPEEKKSSGLQSIIEKIVKLMSLVGVKSASEGVIEDSWTKEASEAVRLALLEKDAGKIKGPGIPDGTGPMSGKPECQLAEKKETPKEEEGDKEASETVESIPAEGKSDCSTASEKKTEESDKEEETPKKKECIASEKVLEEKDVVKEVPAEESIKTASKEKAPEVAEEKAPEVETPVESKVDTEILANSVSFGGVEVPVGYMSLDDVGELTENEKSSLSKLF